MQISAIAIRLLISLALLLNGVPGMAMNGSDHQLGDAQATMNASAGDAPCHATDSAPDKDLGSADMDCCDTATCSCVCVSHVQAIIFDPLLNAHLSMEADRILAGEFRFTEVLPSNRLRPPII